MSAGRMAMPKRATKWKPATDEEIFRSPLLMSTDLSVDVKARALATVEREAGEDAARVAAMLGLVPA